MCPTLCDPWIIPRQVPQSMAFPRQEQWSGGFPGGPVVKNPPSNARDTGSIPGQGSKIPRAIGQISPCCTTREKPPHIITKTQHSQINKWFFKKKNSGLGCHFLLQEIFQTQGLNLGLLLGRQILYHWATSSIIWHSFIFILCATKKWNNATI